VDSSGEKRIFLEKTSIYIYIYISYMNTCFIYWIYFIYISYISHINMKIGMYTSLADLPFFCEFPVISEAF
jgi:hypothetical protein